MQDGFHVVLGCDFDLPAWSRIASCCRKLTVSEGTRGNAATVDHPLFEVKPEEVAKLVVSGSGAGPVAGGGWDGTDAYRVNGVLWLVEVVVLEGAVDACADAYRVDVHSDRLAVPFDAFNEGGD